jgi:hypothetical protein
MSSSALALQQSLYAALSGDETLVSLLGGARIFDSVPQGTPFPYVTLAHSDVTDWSTGTETGDEHIVTLHVWSRDAGRKSVHEIIDRIQTLLHDQSPALTGHRLINLRREYCGVRREPDGDTLRGIIRLRAVTESA